MLRTVTRRPHRNSQRDQSNSTASVTLATRTGKKRVRLGVDPLKIIKLIGIKGREAAWGRRRVVETYAPLDSSNEMTLCKGKLSVKLGSGGSNRDYELQGVTGTRKD